MQEQTEIALGHFTKHFGTLDGLRGVAAITVLVGHAANIFLRSVWVPRKLLAVQFFFMLSGFVISHAYERKLRDGMAWWQFGLRRVIRLYPLIIFGALIGFASYAALHGLHHPGAMSARLTCAAIDVPCLIIPGFEDQYFALNPPEWSLFFEMVAYAFYAGLLCRFSTLAVAAITAMLAPPSIFAAIMFGDHVPFAWHTADALMSYSIGVLLYRFRTARPQNIGFANTATLGMPLVLLAIAPRSIGWWPDLVATFIAFPVIILLGSASPPVRRESTVIRLLGEISFPVYIIHWPILMFALVVFGSASSPIQMIAGIMAALGLAWAILKAYDEPTRRWLSRRAGQRQTQE